MPGSTPGSSSDNSASAVPSSAPAKKAISQRRGQPHTGRGHGLCPVAARRRLPGPGGPGAQGLGQALLRWGRGHQSPARGFITRPTASSARLAVDFTVPRVMPVASAISASDSPP